MPDDEEESGEEQKQSWFQKRKEKKRAKEQANRDIHRANAEEEWKRSNLKTKEGESYKPTQEQIEYEYELKRNEREQGMAKIRKERFAREHPFVTRAEQVAGGLGRQSKRSYEKTVQQVRNEGRKNAKRYGGRSPVKRGQRIPRVSRQYPVVSQHDATAPTGLEAGIMMEFQKPPRQDMFVGGQGNIVERGTQQVNIVERGAQPIIQSTRPQVVRPVMVQQPQVQETTRQMDFFGQQRNQDFFGNQRDILGSSKKMDFGIGNKQYDLGLGKKKKQDKYW